MRRWARLGLLLALAVGVSGCSAPVAVGDGTPTVTPAPLPTDTRTAHPTPASTPTAEPPFGPGATDDPRDTLRLTNPGGSKTVRVTVTRNASTLLDEVYTLRSGATARVLNVTDGSYRVRMSYGGTTTVRSFSVGPDHGEREIDLVLLPDDVRVSISRSSYD